MKYAIIFNPGNKITFLIGFTNNPNVVKGYNYLNQNNAYKLIELRETEDLFISLGSENATYFDIEL